MGLIRLGSSPAEQMKKGWGLDMLASVSVSRRLGIETSNLQLGEKGEERWSRASSLTPLSSSVATPSPTVYTHTHSVGHSRGRSTVLAWRGKPVELILFVQIVLLLVYSGLLIFTIVFDGRCFSFLSHDESSKQTLERSHDPY